MTWELEIHHLDIESVGDATIVVARDIVNNATQRERTVLIDGGKTAAGDIIHGYLTTTLNIARLDVIIVTHYDKDHFQGIIHLLTRSNTTVYDNAIIYDPGRPPDRPPYISRIRNNQGVLRLSDYQKYVAAIQSKQNIKRATVNVNSCDIVNYGKAHNVSPIIPRGMVNNALDPAWLINKELMWGNGGDDSQNNAFMSNPPAGAPTIRCIAANKYVLQQNGTVQFISDQSIFNGPNRDNAARIADRENGYRGTTGGPDDNPKSLGLLIQFNNFRYYVAGDLESVQEDGHQNPNDNMFYSGVRAYINPNGMIADRVLAMKTSHHGANTASSRIFLNQMRPSTALISTGQCNQFNHPAQRTVNILDGYPENPILGDQNNQNRHPSQPPVPPITPIWYYLTGYRDISNPAMPLTCGGDSSVTAGDPNRNVRGHVRLSVSDQQSMQNRRGQLYRGVHAAVQTANQPVGANLQAAIIDAIANAAAMFGPVAAVAAVFGLPIAAIAQPTDTVDLPAAVWGALNAVAYAGDDGNPGIVSAAVAAAASGKVAATSAAANFNNRITMIGNGAAAAIGAAVTGANVATITNDAQGAGASADATTAAGSAAGTIYAMLMGGNNNRIAHNAGFASVAAIGAVKSGASVSQATAIATTIGVTMRIGIDANNDDLYASPQEIVQVIIGALQQASVNNDVAAIASIAASVAYYEGVPQDIKDAVDAALTAIGGQPGNVGTNAQNAATVANNELFTTHFEVNTQDNNGSYVRNIPFTS